jgi:uncharacterized protein
MVRTTEEKLPSPAAALYFGKVMHARLRPVQHRFRYRVMSLLIDLDRLDEADRQSCLFKVNRAALFSFHEVDHGERNGASLGDHARRLAAARGIELSGGRIQLLCYPRLLGFGFNPLSIYFCYRASGELALLIYEVRNTFGEIHPYVLPVQDGHGNGAVVRQSQTKQFYVSPFIEMDTRYDFRLAPLSETVKVRILQINETGPVLAAAFCGSRRPLTSRQLLTAFLAIPLFTFKVVAAIHWEALRLWLKGAAIVPSSRASAQTNGRAPRVRRLSDPKDFDVSQSS